MRFYELFTQEELEEMARLEQEENENEEEYESENGQGIMAFECDIRVDNDNEFDYPEFEFKEYQIVDLGTDSILKLARKEFKVPPYEVLGSLNYINFLAKKLLKSNITTELENELENEIGEMIKRVRRMMLNYKYASREFGFLDEECKHEIFIKQNNLEVK